jgi:hypothetical protein
VTEAWGRTDPGSAAGGANVQPPVSSLTVSRESTSVSPELALVDPGLAEWARERLPVPPDTLEALEAAEPRPLSAPATSARRPRRWRSRVMTWSGMLLLVAGAAFLVGSRADVETPTAAPLVLEPQPAARTADSERANETRTRSPRRSTGVATATRRFAWAPVVGATGYHVELFKGSALILRDETKKPEILIRRRWRFNGRQRRFEPGTYRWYVWPIVGGQREAKAIVQAKLVVPS